MKGIKACYARVTSGVPEVYKWTRLRGFKVPYNLVVTRPDNEKDYSRIMCKLMLCPLAALWIALLSKRII